MHAIRLYRIRLRPAMSFAAVLIISLSLAGFDVAHGSAASITFNSARECDNNAIIKCGALTTNQVVSAYNASSYAQKVYSYFGITKSDIQNLSATASAGSVNKNGDVYIAGKSTPVATNTYSVKAQNINGGTKITASGITFYQEPLSVVVASNSLDAFVVMHNNNFQFAIIASCGNPVLATAKPAVPAKPNTTTLPAVTSQTTPLANTGPSDSAIVGLFVLATMLGTLAFHRHQIRRFESENS